MTFCLNLPQHTVNGSFYLQAVERHVSNTTLASETVIGQDRRHGFLLLLKQQREKYQGRATKQHFIDWSLAK